MNLSLRTRVMFGLLAALAIVVPTTIGQTSAAWNDSAYLTATVTSGTWGPPAPVNTCQVRNANGTVDTSRNCTVSFSSATYWGGAGSGNGYVLFAAVATPVPTSTQYVTFTITIPPAGVPSWWSWSNAATGSHNLGPGGQFTSSCSGMPVLSGRFGANMGGNLNLGFSVQDNRSGAITCQVP